MTDDTLAARVRAYANSLRRLAIKSEDACYDTPKSARARRAWLSDRAQDLRRIATELDALAAEGDEGC